MHTRLLVATLVAGIAACGSIEGNEVMAPRQPLGAGGAGGGGEVTFGGTVQPILLEYCSKCHNASSATGGLDVTSYEMIAMAGVVVPGDPDGSLMIQYLEGGVMPPVGNRGPSDEEIAAIRAWVLAGAAND
ncbi:MAG TPA: c-type cytochrome domain-containing protein [Anaeromyxobacteraceae bacterium]|jgi:hypothetical protein